MNPGELSALVVELALYTHWPRSELLALEVSELVATLDGAGEIGDRYFVTAVPAPHVPVLRHVPRIRDRMAMDRQRIATGEHIGRTSHVGRDNCPSPALIEPNAGGRVMHLSLHGDTAAGPMGEVQIGAEKRLKFILVREVDFEPRPRNPHEIEGPTID